MIHESKLAASKVRVTFLFLGSTGAGPIYSFEMAKAIANTQLFDLQIVISKRVYNLHEWTEEFKGNNTQLCIVDTYRHNKFSFACSFIEFWKINKVVNIIKEFQPECIYDPFPSPWKFLIYPRIKRFSRIITTLHDPHPHDKTTNPLEHWLRQANAKSLQHVNDIIILNQKDVNYVKDNYCKNVWVIPHASFAHYVQNNTAKDKQQLKYTIGFIGRIEPYKGLDILVEAFDTINDIDIKLIIAGAGEIDKKTKQIISKNKKIELINRYIADNEFSELLNKMDFVVLPYKRASQSGVIPLVFAHGKTVIVTDVGSLAEQVPSGTGMVIKPEQKEIASSIRYLYNNPNKIFEYGNNGKDYANTELSWEHSAELLSSIILQSN